MPANPRMLGSLLLASIAALILYTATARAAVRMPPVLARIGQCETRLDWHWSQRDFAGAFGMFRGTWDAYKPVGFPDEPEQASPAQQVRVALIVARRAGWSAWGCFRAYSWVRG